MIYQEEEQIKKKFYSIFGGIFGGILERFKIARG
jgi:hypothetical protein